MSSTSTAAGAVPGLSLSGLERTYDVLAETIDRLPSEKTELMLVKLASLAAREIGDDARFVQLVEAAGRDLQDGRSGSEMSEIPEGFSLHTRRSPLTEPWEPLYARRSASQVELAVLLRNAHCNSRGFVHGGLICALADNAMGLSAIQSQASEGVRAVTVSLNVDFIGSAQIDQWLIVTPMVLKTGGTLAFTQAQVLADGQLVARANATFRLIKGS